MTTLSSITLIIIIIMEGIDNISNVYTWLGVSVSPTGDLIGCPDDELVDIDFDEAFIEWGIWLFIIGECIFDDDDDDDGGGGGNDGGNGGWIDWIFIFG